jgi:hypothetical protein
MNCDIKVDKYLGHGQFGVVFQHKNCILKIGSENNEEFKCLQKLYVKLYKCMPDHIINPIKKWECKLNELDVNIKTQIISNIPITTLYDKNPPLYLILLDKLGDCTFFDYWFHNIPNEKVYKAILFQLLIYFCYIRKYTKIIHYDLHDENIILKRTNKTLGYVYKIENQKYCITMKPKFIAYPIDFGNCKYTEEFDDIKGNTDITDLFEIFDTIIDKYKPLLSESFIMFFKNFDSDEINLKSLEKLLKHKFFSDVVDIKKT